MMHAEFPEMRSGRLLLRQFKDVDLENVFKGLSDPAVIQYYGVSYDSLEATRTQMQFFCDLEKNGTGTWWAICNQSNDIFYGATGLNSLSMQHKKAEIGFWLLPQFWGQGIITEAVPLVCKHGFSHFGLHRIEALIETNNHNSKRVMTKLHFTHEGTMKECEIKNGAFISLDIYAKLNNTQQ